MKNLRVKGTDNTGAFPFIHEAPPEGDNELYDE